MIMNYQATRGHLSRITCAPLAEMAIFSTFVRLKWTYAFQNIHNYNYTEYNVAKRTIQDKDSGSQHPHSDIRSWESGLIITCYWAEQWSKNWNAFRWDVARISFVCLYHHSLQCRLDSFRTLEYRIPFGLHQCIHTRFGAIGQHTSFIYSLQV